MIYKINITGENAKAQRALINGSNRLRRIHGDYYSSNNLSDLMAISGAPSKAIIRKAEPSTVTLEKVKYIFGEEITIGAGVTVSILHPISDWKFTVSLNTGIPITLEELKHDVLNGPFQVMKLSTEKGLNIEFLTDSTDELHQLNSSLLTRFMKWFTVTDNSTGETTDFREISSN